MNDFAAAGLGVSQIKEKDYWSVNKAEPVPNGVRIVTGPGTGFGQAFLVKSKFSPCYEVYPSEGGHVDFPARSREDFELLEFARDYVENSNNIENLRGKAKTQRISIERVCAGPAVPLIYEFFKTKINEEEMPRVLETGPDAKKPDEITSMDIVSAGTNSQNRDPLCRKVIEKFLDILAVEVGNHGLKCLPFGGIFLIGGVTNGISDLILNDDSFMNTLTEKGRLHDMMHRFPVLLVKPDVELGLLGAEE